jgi:hypothetical protein
VNKEFSSRTRLFLGAIVSSMHFSPALEMHAEEEGWCSSRDGFWHRA